DSIHNFKFHLVINFWSIMQNKGMY
ncbi:hypothetical protein AZZ66_003720, partial [Escherichia coli]